MAKRMDEKGVEYRDLKEAGRDPEGSSARGENSRRVAYIAPRLERVGAWRALTLQQTIPIE